MISFFMMLLPSPTPHPIIDLKPSPTPGIYWTNSPLLPARIKSKNDKVLEWDIDAFNVMNAEGENLLVVRQNGNIFLRGKKIGRDKEVGKILTSIGRGIK